MSSSDRYKIVRKFFKGKSVTIQTNLTLEEAQAHCQDPETSHETCKKPHNRRRTRQHGQWFDVYYRQ